MNDKTEAATPEEKNDESEIIEAESVQLVTKDDAPKSMQLGVAVQMSPIQIMQEAKAAGLTVDEMREMLKIQKDFEKNEARKAFHQALSEFKKNPPKVVRDLINSQYGSSYTSLGNMVNSVNGAMSPFGLNARWSFPQDEANKITVTCILAHTLGHEEEVTLSGMPDTSGSKNPLQEAKSARTYLKLETFEAVTGMASVAGNIDDDGNGASAPIELITEDQSTQIHAKLTDNSLDVGIFLNFLKTHFTGVEINTFNDIPADKFDLVMGKLDSTIAGQK